MGLRPHKCLDWAVFSTLLVLAAGLNVRRERTTFNVTDDFPEWRYMNLSADPCDDFYEFTCGNFENVKPIPQGYPYLDHYAMVQDEVEQKCKDIIEEPKSESDPSALRKVKDMYSACMNTYFMNRLGLRKLSSLLDRLGGVPMITPNWTETKAFTMYDVADIVAEFGLPIFMNFYVQSNMMDSNQMMVYIDKDGLPLPFQIVDYPIAFEQYVEEQIQNKNTGDIPYVKYLIELTTILQKYACTNIDQEQVRQEILTAIQFMQVVKQVNPDLIANIEPPQNPNTLAYFQAWTDKNFGNKIKLDWVKFMRHVFASADVTITDETVIFIPNWEFIIHVLQLIEASDPRIVNNFVFMRLLTYLSPEGDASMRQAAERFYDTLGHVKYPRWKTCLRKAMDFPTIGMTSAIAYEYKSRHVPEEMLQRVNTMVSELRTSFDKLLDANQWMDEATKKLAQEKANAFLVQLGYPEEAGEGTRLDSYFKNLRVCRYDHFGNMYRLRAFNLRQNLELLGKPRDRNVWSQSPLLVNAYYNGINNRLTIPISLMHPPFFGSGLRIVEYSRIGAVIGHEITHAFDNKSKNLDGEGQLTDWWMGNTLAEYNKKADCFVKQYNEKIIPEIGLPVPGERTLNENIADNGGLRESFLAYKGITKNPDSDFVLNGERWSTEQLFFIGYGTGWCKGSTHDDFINNYNKIVHSPNRFRANVPASNMPEFAKAFQCPIGSQMNPETRCRIW